MYVQDIDYILRACQLLLLTIAAILVTKACPASSYPTASRPGALDPLAHDWLGEVSKMSIKLKDYWRDNLGQYKSLSLSV